MAAGVIARAPRGGDRSTAARQSDTSGLAAATADADQPPAEDPRQKGRLFFASFLMLFTELTLIRWITANNVFVTEATNFVLLASFLGIGIGFLNARSGRNYLRWTPVALLALVGFVLAFPVVLQAGGPTPFRGIGHIAALPRPLSFAGVFLLTVAVMAGLGQAVARIFVGFRPLSAYRLDILGSIAGIAVFSALSFLQQPPFIWGLVAGGGLAGLLLPKIKWWQAGAVLLALALLGIESYASAEHWSPYNKLVLHKQSSSAIRVTANNIPFQTIHSIALLQAHFKFYFFPYRHVSRQSLGNVLIIGAGTGNDVAVALAHGARRIDAVEIDPELPAAGRRLHPEHPYQDPRVTVHIADGRQFLQNTTQHYDLIMFALPDSLTALAGQSGIRLESYLLTENSLAEARQHLAPGGTFAMYNWYAPFVLNRYASELIDVYHRTPCLELSNPGRARTVGVLTVAPGRAVPNCARLWHGQRVSPATDNWPFPYLPTASVPLSYVLMLGAILLASILLVRVGGGSFTRMTSYVDLAFMGAAFMLLETKNIVGFALLFGTTWFVNALVFAAVLGAVYLAVETARWVRLPPPLVLYGGLIASLVVTWLVPQASLLSLPLIPRFLAAAALGFAPVFVANLIFAQRFKEIGSSGTAFAANLLGAMVGGTLEYLTLITGYRASLIAVAALYGLAYVTGRRRPAEAAPVPGLKQPLGVST
jgi:SAM-dependent methyltransferase